MVESIVTHTRRVIGNNLLTSVSAGAFDGLDSIEQLWDNKANVLALDLKPCCDDAYCSYIIHTRGSRGAVHSKSDCRIAVTQGNDVLAPFLRKKRCCIRWGTESSHPLLTIINTATFNTVDAAGTSAETGLQRYPKVFLKTCRLQQRCEWYGSSIELFQHCYIGVHVARAISILW